MIEKLEKLESRYKDLEKNLADPGIMPDKGLYQKLAKEYSDISQAVKKYRYFKSLSRELAELEALIKVKGTDDLAS